MKQTKPIRKRSAQAVKDHTFELIMQRFDTVDKDNKDIKDHIAQHIVDDGKTHAKLTQTLDKHTTYWGLLTTTATTATGVIVAWVNKWI